MSTMGELHYRFERVVFESLSKFQARQKDPHTDANEFVRDCKDFYNLCEDIRATLDIAEYEKKLEKLEARFK